MTERATDNEPLSYSQLRHLATRLQTENERMRRDRTNHRRELKRLNAKLRVQACYLELRGVAVDAHDGHEAGKARERMQRAEAQVRWLSAELAKRDVAEAQVTAAMCELSATNLEAPVSFPSIVDALKAAE